MSIDFASLKSEIDTDPLNLGFAALVSQGNDQGIVDLLNNKGYTLTQPLSIITVLKWGAANGVLANINDGQTSAATPQLKAICLAAMKIMGNFQGTLDVTDPQIQGLVTAMASGGIMTSSQASELLSLGNQPASRVEVLFGIGNSVDQGDISFALRNQR